ncbi:ABC transporter permease [Myxococcota bacterium]|nr:ABC transporter permease [Myxococcota bacterium]
MPIDVFLALKFLREGRLQSWLLVAGAAVGVTVVFFVTALISAVERTMVRQTLDVLPHVVVRRADETSRPLPVAPEGTVTFAQVDEPAKRLRSIESWGAIVRELEAIDGVEAVSPTATGPALASRGRGTRGITILGVDPERFAKVIAITPRIRRGVMRVTGEDVLIGTKLADDLGVDVGDRIRISAAEDRQASFVVAGVFDMGNSDVNRRWVVMALRTGQTLLDMPGGVSAIDVRTSDIWRADALADRAHAVTGLEAESWSRSNKQLMIAIQSQRGSTLTIKVFIMVAVAMGIASVLVVSVVQRAKQIGILRAMGMPRQLVLRIFLLQGTAMGTIGAVIGCALGSALSIASELMIRAPDGSALYPIELPLSLFAASGGVAMLTGLVGAVLPSRRAARLDPAVAIRHD